MSNTALKTRTKLPRIALTAGEPAGIGPDLCAQLEQRLPDAQITVIADRALIEQRAQLLGLPLGNLNIHHIRWRPPANRASSTRPTAAMFWKRSATPRRAA
jgi:4-hydroxy-L-threonine phosphate dehydrogenase PdxA